MANSSARAFDHNNLTAALALTGKATPTQEDMAVALELLFGDRMTVEKLLADGWMTTTVDGQRLREPPLTPAEITRRLATPEVGVAPAMSPTAEPTPAQAANSGYFSYFTGGITSTKPTLEIGVRKLYQRLIDPENRPRIEAMRCAEGEARKKAKSLLDYVTPAGIFTHRANIGLVTASGLLVLDFDHLPDVGAARAALLADKLLRPELVLLFVSPSGDGLKALLRTDPEASHSDSFRAYTDYLWASYPDLGLVPDESGKDVARACFVSYDPEAWLAPILA